MYLRVCSWIVDYMYVYAPVELDGNYVGIEYPEYQRPIYMYHPIIDIVALLSFIILCIRLCK